MTYLKGETLTVTAFDDILTVVEPPVSWLDYRVYVIFDIKARFTHYHCQQYHNIPHHCSWPWYRGVFLLRFILRRDGCSQVVRDFSKTGQYRSDSGTSKFWWI